MLQAKVDPSYLKLLEAHDRAVQGRTFRSRSGRPKNRLVFYMGSTGGGVWKTESVGIAWRNISDGSFKTGSVGAIAVPQSDPNVTYLGMGENYLSGELQKREEFLEGVRKTEWAPFVARGA